MEKSDLCRNLKFGGISEKDGPL